MEENNVIKLSDLSGAFSKKRMKIIEVLRDKKPNSVSELSSILDRDIAAVYRDLKILEKCNIISIMKSGRSAKPILEKECLVIQLKKEIKKEEELEENDNYVM